MSATHTFDQSGLPAAIHVGDTVTWTWATSGHTVTSGTRNAATTACTSDGKFGSPQVLTAGSTYSFTFTQTGDYPYFCEVHCSHNNMTGVIIVQ
jgi:plastocyanin